MLTVQLDASHVDSLLHQLKVHNFVLALERTEHIQQKMHRVAAKLDLTFIPLKGLVRVNLALLLTASQ